MLAPICAVLSSALSCCAGRRRRMGRCWGARSAVCRPAGASSRAIRPPSSAPMFSQSSPLLTRQQPVHRSCQSALPRSANHGAVCVAVRGRREGALADLPAPSRPRPSRSSLPSNQMKICSNHTSVQEARALPSHFVSHRMCLPPALFPLGHVPHCSRSSHPNCSRSSHPNCSHFGTPQCTHS